MARPAPVIDFTGEPALLRAIDDWRAWLEVERNCSPNTLDGYGRDLAAFLNYLAAHAGHAPGLPDIQVLEASDFRGYLAMRANQGVSRASTARAMSGSNSSRWRLEIAQGCADMRHSQSSG